MAGHSLNQGIADGMVDRVIVKKTVMTAMTMVRLVDAVTTREVHAVIAVATKYTPLRLAVQ